MTLNCIFLFFSVLLRLSQRGFYDLGQDVIYVSLRSRVEFLSIFVALCKAWQWLSLTIFIRRMSYQFSQGDFWDKTSLHLLTVTARCHWYLKCNKPFNHHSNLMNWVHYDSHFRVKEVMSQRGQVLAWVPSPITWGLSQNWTCTINPNLSLNLYTWVHTVRLCVAWIFIFNKSTSHCLETYSDVSVQQGSCLSPPTLAALLLPLLYHTDLSEASWGRASPIHPCTSFLVMLFPWKCQATFVWVEKTFQNLVYSIKWKMLLVVRWTFSLHTFEKEKFCQLNFDLMLSYHLEFLVHCHWKNL